MGTLQQQRLRRLLGCLDGLGCLDLGLGHATSGVCTARCSFLVSRRRRGLSARVPRDRLEIVLLASIACFVIASASRHVTSIEARACRRGRVPGRGVLLVYCTGCTAFLTLF